MTILGPPFLFFHQEQAKDCERALPLDVFILLTCSAPEKLISPRGASGRQVSFVAIARVLKCMVINVCTKLQFPISWLRSKLPQLLQIYLQNPPQRWVFHAAVSPPFLRLHLVMISQHSMHTTWLVCFLFCFYFVFKLFLSLYLQFWVQIFSRLSCRWFKQSTKLSIF